MRHSLVTGGAGFIGSHLVEALLARGDHVSVIDDESTGTRANLAAVMQNRRLLYVRGSVADRVLVRYMLDGIDDVYHLAAAVGVRLIAESPIHTIEANIYPMELLLAEISRLQDAGRSVRLFLASSSEVYGKNPKPVWREEDDMVFGPTTRSRWSYGTSKAIDEFLALAYWREKQLPTVVGRFFNVIGRRQTGAYGMVLPRLVDAALAGGPLVVHDDGRQERCFAHVGDVVRAVMALMDNPRAVGRVFNIGSDRAVSISDLAQRVIWAVDPGLQIQFISYAAAYGADFEDCRRRVPDLTRLRETIGAWECRTLEETIAEVVAWKRSLRTF